MGLLNSNTRTKNYDSVPHLARNERQGLLSPMEIAIDTAINNPLRPNMSSNMMQQDLINKGLMIAGFAPFGIVSPKTGANIDDLIKKAKQHFGTTFNPKEAGYISPDGAMLDLSGRHYGTGYARKGKYKFEAKEGNPDYLGNARNVDHREVGDVIGSGGNEGLSKMQDAGFIRWSPESPGFQTIYDPTEEQLMTIVKAFNPNGRYPRGTDVYIDIADPNNYQVTGGGLLTTPFTIEQIKKIFNK